jgi:AcrR family transcriptional regulator
MAGPTPRQIAREQTLQRIKTLALAQLAESGAGELSLRAIARELNLVSSAIYRYFGSRDELITALIVDAYDDLAAALEAAAAGGRRTPHRRWSDVCTAMRDWALAEPHRYGLIYGTAIPGYRAPADTIEPAARVLRALCSPVVGAEGRAADAAIGRRLQRQLATTRDALDLTVDDPTMLALVGAFGRVVGLITLELGGHFVGGFEPADDLFTSLVAREADLLGL